MQSQSLANEYVWVPIAIACESLYTCRESNICVQTFATNFKSLHTCRSVAILNQALKDTHHHCVDAYMLTGEEWLDLGRLWNAWACYTKKTQVKGKNRCEGYHCGLCGSDARYEAWYTGGKCQLCFNIDCGGLHCPCADSSASD